MFVTAAARRVQEFQTTVEPLQCFLLSLGESCTKKTGFADHHVSRHVPATVGATFHQVQAGRAKLDVQHSLINFFFLLLFWSQSTPGNFVALQPLNVPLCSAASSSFRLLPGAYRTAPKPLSAQP